MITKVVQAVREDIQGYEINGTRFYDHIITIEGVDYHYDSKSPTLVNFVAGKEATFTTEEKMQKNNKVRLKIVPVKENPFKGGGAKSGGFPAKGNYSKDDGAISMLSCISSAANYHKDREGTFDTVLKDAEKAYNLVKTKRGDFN
jgi:hypothetical protein